MKPECIVEYVTQNYQDVYPKSSWGETSLFYNPGQVLPNGVYFCTIKENDGENDKASNLDRDGVFRLSIGVGNEMYATLFGAKPIHQRKGKLSI